MADNEQVDHPAHYGGADNPYEAIKVIEAWALGFNLGNAVKYVSRAGKKDAAEAMLELIRPIVPVAVSAWEARPPPPPAGG